MSHQGHTMMLHTATLRVMYLKSINVPTLTVSEIQPRQYVKGQRHKGRSNVKSRSHNDINHLLLLHYRYQDDDKGQDHYKQVKRHTEVIP